MSTTAPAPDPGPARTERFTVRLETYRRIAEVSLIALVLIVFTGAGVRLTGSGLGCPDWPACRGEFVPPLDTHTWLEYGNRLLSAAVGIPCFLAGVLAFRLRPRRRDLRWPGMALLIGVLAQGLLGGLTVILDLHWQVVIAHYLLSIVLLTAAALLVWRVRRPPDAPRPEHGRRLVGSVRFLVAYGAYIIVAGTFATAAGPHAGGAGTGDVVERLDAFGDGTLRSLIYLHGHSATAMGLGSVALWFYARARGAGPQLQRTLTAICLLIAAQGIAGLAQYHLALPAEIVWIHASLAAVMWCALMWAWLSAGRSAPART